MLRYDLVWCGEPTAYKWCLSYNYNINDLNMEWYDNTIPSMSDNIKTQASRIYIGITPKNSFNQFHRVGGCKHVVYCNT